MEVSYLPLCSTFQLKLGLQLLHSKLIFFVKVSNLLIKRRGS